MLDIKLGNTVDPNLASNSEKQKWIKIPINLIDEYEYSYVFTDGNVDRFVESIKEIGILSPIEVVKKEGRYVVISGHTRLRALKKIYQEDPEAEINCNGVSLHNEAPAIITNNKNDEVDLFERFVEANLQRHASASEREETARKIIEKYDEIIERTGKPKGRKRKIIGDWSGLSEPTVQRLINEHKDKTNKPTKVKKELTKAEVIVKKINAVNNTLSKLDVPALKGIDLVNYKDSLNRLMATISDLLNNE